MVDGGSAAQAHRLLEVGLPRRRLEESNKVENSRIKYCHGRDII